MAVNFPDDLTAGNAPWSKIDPMARDEHFCKNLRVRITDPSTSPKNLDVQYYILEIDGFGEIPTEYHQMSSTADSFVEDINEKLKDNRHLMALEKPTLKAWLQLFVRN